MSESQKLLQSAVVVSADNGLRRDIRAVFSGMDMQTQGFADARRAQAAMAHAQPDVVLLDAVLEEGDKTPLLRWACERGIDVVVVVEAGDLQSGIRALREGASDFVEFPFDFEALQASLERTARYRTLEQQRTVLAGRLQVLSNELNVRATGDNVMVGSSLAMRKVAQDIVAYAATSATVLILGESGTGKEVIANALHASSPRQEKPCLTLNCSAIAETLFESEVFGHRRGAFTGATENQVGYVEAADGGTLFLDEIGDLPLGAQAKFLRLLEQKAYLPVGETVERTADIRIVAATNQPIANLVREGKFREDLFYRLSVCTIHVPPLRERVDDIGLLATYFAMRFAAEMGKPLQGISDEALAMLEQYSFPGNVRELRNMIESAVIRMRSEGLLGVEDITLAGVPGVAAAAQGFEGWPDEDLHHHSVEARLYREALSRTGGNIAAAARLINMERNRLRRQMKLVGVESPRARRRR